MMRLLIGCERLRGCMPRGVIASYGLLHLHVHIIKYIMLNHQRNHLAPFWDRSAVQSQKSKTSVGPLLTLVYVFILVMRCLQKVIKMIV